MGLLTRLLTSWGSQYRTGETSAKEEVELATLKEKLAALKRAALLGEKPVWSKLTPGMEYDPAAEKMLPGQQRMEAGGKYYRPPVGKTRGEMVGKTYGELGALGGIVKDLPIGQLITAKAGPKMMRPWLSELMAPEGVKETMGGVMYPTKELRGLEQYLGVMGAMEKAKGILPEQREGLKDIAETLFGYREKVQRPTITMAKPGETPFVTRGERMGERMPQIPPGEGKPRPGILGQYDEWRKDHPGQTFEDYKRAMKGISLMEAPPSIEDLSDQVRKWMSIEMGGLENKMLITMMAILPEGDPMGDRLKEAYAAQDLTAIKEEARKHREYYQELLEEAQIKKEYPNAKQDEYGNWTVTIEGKEYVITP